MKRLFDISLKLITYLSFFISGYVYISFCMVLMGRSEVLAWLLLVISSFALLLLRRRRKEESQRPKLITTIFSAIGLSTILFLFFYWLQGWYEIIFILYLPWFIAVFLYRKPIFRRFDI